MRFLLTAFMLFTTLAAVSQKKTDAERYCDLDSDPSLEALRTGYSIFIDQDMAWPAYNQDRDYTMGLGFRFYGRRFDSKRKPISWLTMKAMTGLNTLVGLQKHFEKYGYESRTSFMLGNGSFTPDSLLAKNPVKGDRPYGSVLYFSHRKSYLPAGTKHIISTQFTLGFLGTAVSKYFQKGVHYLYRNIAKTEEPYDPKGWDNQISKGGEITVMYRVAYGKSFIDNRYLSISACTEGMAGYYTNVAFSGQVRTGKLVSRWFTLVSDPLSDGSQASDGREGFEIYAYGVPRVRFVAYNALLQGQFRHNDYELGWNDMRHVIGELDCGIAMGNSFCRNNRKGIWSFGLNFSLRTPNYTGPYSRYHHWGGFYFTKSFL
ncbi:MAG: DUF2219 family protein [Cyclobacteriaceae bacterium]